MRPVTIFAGQWADMPFDTLCSKMSSWGYDGPEIACWGEHLNLDKAVESDAYVRTLKDAMEMNRLQCHAIGNHLAGQLVCSRNNERFDVFAPGELHGQPEKMRAQAGDDDVALGAIQAIQEAKREGEMFIVPGAGMKDIVKMVMDGSEFVPCDVTYPVSMAATAVTLGVYGVRNMSVPGFYQSTIPAKVILSADLITKENAAKYYAPDSIY